MNLLISAFQEPRWRRRLVARAGLRPGGAALDVASGTGKVAADLHGRVQPFGRVHGRRPLTRDDRRRRRAVRAAAGPRRTSWATRSTCRRSDASFDAATIAFGMRNLPDYRRGFEEMARSVRPGGRVLCLEIARPRSRLARFMRWWFDRIVPVIGRVGGPGRRLRLPRPERAGLPGAGADRRDHGRGRPGGRALAGPHRRDRHAPRGHRPSAAVSRAGILRRVPNPLAARRRDHRACPARPRFRWLLAVVRRHQHR